jgi:hypothetical protein
MLKRHARFVDIIEQTRKLGETLQVEIIEEERKLSIEK